MNALAPYIKARLSEASTLRGLILLASGLLGYDLSDADATQLIAAGQILVGVFGAALPDRRQP